MPELRRAVFLLLCLAMLAALVVLGLRREAPTAPPPSPRLPSLVEPTTIEPSPPPGARPAVLRFLAAFLRYEFGETDAATRYAIGLDSTARFGSQLLARPPRRPPGGEPGRARIVSLRVDPVPGRAHLALAIGTARRPSGPEPFSFLFARRADRWLAVAPGE